MPRRSPRFVPPPEDPYRVLGVPRDADLPTIKQAFRERALECHPDRAAAGEEDAATDEFVRVRAAFDVLSDPELRHRYDTERRSQSPHRSSTSTRPRQTKRRPKRGASRADARTRRSAHRRKGGRFATAWRTGDTPNVWVGPMSNRVRGLSQRHDRLHQHHRRVVPISAVAGAALFVAQPSIIHTSIPLVGLLLCIVISAACGFALSMILGVAHMLVADYHSTG
ncbi:hypothetical protein CRI93_12810 [Longimonas halophila]|uniref:J domain-containing protein n=1 Tax=Longimonas halophila TaxID=1469170 RepID=A0A2H3NXX5_9BACT|nr:J domain-containing protein [Longimonas halophila]PEN05392.1 hypothetical protein CRI93_12810 [Longimonas halophila]